LGDAEYDTRSEAMSSDDDLMADKMKLSFKQTLDDGSLVYCFLLSGFYEAWSWLKGLVKDEGVRCTKLHFCCVSGRLRQHRGIVGLSMSRYGLRDEKTNCANLLSFFSLLICIFLRLHFCDFFGVWSRGLQ
jgi:hypothetical protein